MFKKKNGKNECGRQSQKHWAVNLLVAPLPNYTNKLHEEH